MSQGPGRSFGRSKITKGCLYLLVGSVSVSLLYLLSQGDMRTEITRLIAASGQSIWGDFKIWQIGTSPFLEANFVSLIFQSVMLWMFIPTLERWWGTRRFLKFAAITSATGVVAGTLAGYVLPSVPDSFPIVGLDPLIYASIVAFGMLFAKQQVQFFGVLPMTGRQLTIGICGFMLFFVVLGQSWAEGVAFCSAMFVAWGMTNGKWTPKIWLLKRKQKRIRRHLKVVKDQEESDKPRGGWLN